jgi:hypothetical protein
VPSSGRKSLSLRILRMSVSFDISLYMVKMSRVEVALYFSRTVTTLVQEARASILVLYDMTYIMRQYNIILVLVYHNISM